MAMVRQAHEMMIENLKISQDQQRQTIKTIQDQQAIRERATVFENDYDDEEDNVIDEPMVNDEMTAAEKLVSEIWPMIQSWLPSIMEGEPIAGTIRKLAIAHPLFQKLLDNEPALGKLAYMIWTTFGRQELITVVETLGLPPGLIEAASAIVESVKAANAANV